MAILLPEPSPGRSLVFLYNNVIFPTKWICLIPTTMKRWDGFYMGWGLIGTTMTYIIMVMRLAKNVKHTQRHFLPLKKVPTRWCQHDIFICRQCFSISKIERKLSMPFGYLSGFDQKLKSVPNNLKVKSSVRKQMQ